MKKTILIVTMAASAFTGCYYDNVEELNASTLLEPCDTAGTMSYANDIQPILTSRCGSNDVGCHSADNSLALGGSSGSLADYNGTIETINDRGPIDFMQRVNHDPNIPSTKWMPKGSSSKIESCSIIKLQLWIDQGLQNN